MRRRVRYWLAGGLLIAALACSLVAALTPWAWMILPAIGFVIASAYYQE